MRSSAAPSTTTRSTPPSTAPSCCGPVSRSIAPTAKAIVTAEAIDVTSLELHQGAGFLDGRVRYAWETGAYNASLKGDRLSWQGTVLSPNDTQAIFAVQFDGTGTAAQPKGQLKLDFALTGGKAGTFIGAGDATADLLGDQARIVARLPSIGALINADIATASPYDYRATAQLDRFELARLSSVTNSAALAVKLHKHYQHATHRESASPVQSPGKQAIRIVHGAWLTEHQG